MEMPKPPVGPTGPTTPLSIEGYGQLSISATLVSMKHAAGVWALAGDKNEVDSLKAAGTAVTAAMVASSVNFSGVYANSKQGRGIEGWSINNYGVSGDSTSFAGVRGTSVTAAGTEGWSTNGAGVFGTSKTGDGVYGICHSAPGAPGAGVHGVNDHGGNAAAFDGTVQVNGNINVTGDIFLPGADCAEQFDFVEIKQIDAGTVVVINEEGRMAQSQEAYDKKVAGVVSGAGHYRPAIILDKQSSRDKRLPIALIGKVYCKVDAQYSPVRVGDLLTTSATPGHAMKAEDPVKAFGAVLGKALGNLESGKGLLPILVALQ